MNFAKFLRTPFLQNTSCSCLWQFNVVSYFFFKFFSSKGELTLVVKNFALTRPYTFSVTPSFSYLTGKSYGKKLISCPEYWKKLISCPEIFTHHHFLYHYHCTFAGQQPWAERAYQCRPRLIEIVTQKYSPRVWKHGKSTLEISVFSTTTGKYGSQKLRIWALSSNETFRTKNMSIPSKHLPAVLSLVLTSIFSKVSIVYFKQVIFC